MVIANQLLSTGRKGLYSACMQTRPVVIPLSKLVLNNRRLLLITDRSVPLSFAANTLLMFGHELHRKKKMVKEN